MDGAHTHHHGSASAGVGTAVLIGAGLAVTAQVANAVAAIVHVLLVGLVIATGLALVALTAYAVTVYRRHQVAWYQSTPSRLPPAPEDAELPGDREVVSLRQAITDLRAQLTAARAALDSVNQPEAHQHLHFHGLNPAQVAAILANYRKQGGDDR